MGRRKLVRGTHTVRWALTLPQLPVPVQWLARNKPPYSRTRKVWPGINSAVLERPARRPHKSKCIQITLRPPLESKARMRKETRAVLPNEGDSHPDSNLKSIHIRPGILTTALAPPTRSQTSSCYAAMASRMLLVRCMHHGCTNHGAGRVVCGRYL